MQKLTLALATDDGREFMTRHFGDAACYHIIELSPHGIRHLDTVENDVDEEEGHADPRKARGIAELLLGRQVHVAAAPVFGPNLKRIRKKFACILAPRGKLADFLERARTRYPEIVACYEEGPERCHLDWSRE